MIVRVPETVAMKIIGHKTGSVFDRYDITKEKRLNGGEGQNRTVDTTIFSRMLYQLSYLATPGERVRHGRDTRTGERRRS